MYCVREEFSEELDRLCREESLDKSKRLRFRLGKAVNQSAVHRAPGTQIFVRSPSIVLDKNGPFCPITHRLQQPLEKTTSYEIFSVLDPRIAKTTVFATLHDS